MKKRLRKKRAKRTKGQGFSVWFNPSAVTNASLVRFDPLAPVKIEVLDRTEGPGYSTVSFRFLS